jgi:hypothetical protein
MINALAEIGTSLLGTLLSMVITVPYIVGWKDMKNFVLTVVLGRNNEGGASIDSALAKLDADFAIKHGEAEE